MKPFLHLLFALGLAMPATQAEPCKIYMIGNSLTDEVKYDTWIEFCAGAGVEALYGRKMIPGAPIEWHRTHPEDGFLTKPYGYPEVAFKNFPWDALTLQPFRPGEEEAAGYYAELMWKTNPRARIFVYAQWPSRKSEDWTGMWLAMKGPVFFSVLEALRKTPRGDQVFLIPAGQALYRLHKKMQLGLVPGFREAWDLYQDGVHVNNIGSCVVGTSFYATIFRKSPVGLGVGGYQGETGTQADYHPISPDLAKMIQTTVWEAVTGAPESGVTSEEPPAVTLPALLPAVEKEPYFLEIDAAYGRPPYRWSVAGGKLPDGVTLNGDGFLQGTPAAGGDYPFTAQATDSAGQTASREFTLNVGADVAPSIVTKTLPALVQGRFVDARLQAGGGNGVIGWSVESGELPRGLILEKSGRLYGSPGIDGSYDVTLRATDGDGTAPESATRQFSGEIAPADPGSVFFARHAGRAPKVDGQLAGEEGWHPRTELKKPLAGVPDNTVRFDVQWFEDTLYIALEVEDDTVITKEGWGPRHSDMDCMVFYFDGLNNREATYNFDDRRMVFGPTSQGSHDREYSIGPRLGGDFKSTRTATGYVMEGKLQLDAMGVPDQVPGGKFDAAGAVIGFDIVNRDLDAEKGEQTRLGWRGTANNPDDPSQFGTLILLP